MNNNNNNNNIKPIIQQRAIYANIKVKFCGKYFQLADFKTLQILFLLFFKLTHFILSPKNYDNNNNSLHYHHQALEYSALPATASTAPQTGYESSNQSDCFAACTPGVCRCRLDSDPIPSP